MKKSVLTLIILLSLTKFTFAQEYNLMQINRIKKAKEAPPQKEEVANDPTQNDPTGYFFMGSNPTLTSFINGRLLAPTVNIAGSNYSQKGNFMGSVFLFKSSISDKAEDSLQLRTHLFNTDASIFGFSGNFILMAKDSLKSEMSKKYPYKDSRKHFSLRGQFSFLQKRLYMNNGEKFEPYLFHFRTGIEYMPIPDWVSFYVNFSLATPVTQITSFRNLTNYNKTSYMFLDYGVRCDLKLGDNSSINLDLNFVGVTSSVKKISGTKDLVIPSIRIGVSQNIVSNKVSSNNSSNKTKSGPKTGTKKSN
jgi:hypothetical protein